MRCLNKNKQKFYYALYLGKEEVLDGGLMTGDYKINYSEPVMAKMNISPSKGLSFLDEAGLITEYDRLIVTDDLNCPFDINTVLWIDKEPVENGETTPYNYIIKRVSPSINSITYSIKEVENDKES